jgi:hypothetical protein
MAASPWPASTLAIVLFPAPEQPVISTALIGVYGGPAAGGGANEFGIPVHSELMLHGYAVLTG